MVFYWNSNNNSGTIMSTAAGAALSNTGLTVLSEEEDLFRASVREFAEGEVRPKVEHMERDAKLDADLIKQCFELGLMAIESPEEYGGAGSTIFNAIVAIEELARVDASLSVFEIGRHTSELQSRLHLVCRLLLEKK